MNTFWLIVFIFSSEGEFLEKSSYEAANKEQCVQMAGEEARKNVNTQTQVQFYCVSDDHYQGRSVDENIPLD
jgi:hypothetical protein